MMILALGQVSSDNISTSDHISVNSYSYQFTESGSQAVQMQGLLYLAHTIFYAINAPVHLQEYMLTLRHCGEYQSIVKQAMANF